MNLTGLNVAIPDSEIVANKVAQYNAALQAVDDGLTKETQVIDLSGGNYTLSEAEARCAVIRLGGAIPANRTVLIPTTGARRFMTFSNETTEGGSSTTVTVKVVGGSVGVTVDRATSALLRWSGTSVLSVSSAIPGGGGVVDSFIRTSSYASLPALLTALGSTPTLVLVDSVVTVAADASIPSTISLWFIEPGKFSVNSTKVLTIVGAITASPRQIFAGAGTVSFSGNRAIEEYCAEWLGAPNDGSADAGPYFNALQFAKPAGAPTKLLPNAIYALSTSLISHGKPMCLIGDGVVGAQISNGIPTFRWIGASGGTMIDINNSIGGTPVYYIRFQGFGMQAKYGSSEADNGIKVDIIGGGGAIEAKMIFDNLMIAFEGVRSTFAGINLSETAVSNLENILISNSQIVASSDNSDSNPSRGVAVLLGANTNQISVALFKVWLRNSRTALKAVGGNLVSIKQSIILASDTAIQTQTNTAIHDIRFENVPQILKIGAGSFPVEINGCTLSYSSLTPSSPFIDLNNAGTKLTMIDNFGDGGTPNPACVVFANVGNATLFSRHNDFPAVTNLGLSGFISYDTGQDSGIAQNGSNQKTGGGGAILLHKDQTSEIDPLPKVGLVGGLGLYVRSGWDDFSKSDHTSNLKYSFGAITHDVDARAAWRERRIHGTTNASSSYSLDYFAPSDNIGVTYRSTSGLGLTNLFKGAAVASASSIAPTGNLFHVTGTTNITSIDATGILAGTRITIIFDDVLTFTDGNNLKLAGNFVTSADDTIVLEFDGTNFYEVSRSVN
jgi:hypothetical protein